MPCVFSGFCLRQGYKQCALVINDYYIVYSNIILSQGYRQRIFWHNILNINVVSLITHCK